MTRKILIILGHPAHGRQTFCEALSRAYQEGAQQAGHEVHFLKIANLIFDPILHEGYDADQPPESDLILAQEEIKWADHLVIVYPLWNYMLPALLKGFLERTFTEGFAYNRKENNRFPEGLLKEKSAHLIQTMGMPAFIYKWFFRAHSTKAFKDKLKACGITPTSCSYLGRIEELGTAKRKNILNNMKQVGHRGV